MSGATVVGISSKQVTIQMEIVDLTLLLLNFETDKMNMETMLTPKFNILLNNKYFDALYPVDYYNDKSLFHDSGARQFFVIYQLAASRKHELTIEETGINSKIVMNNELQFKEWVAENYPMYLNYLENYN